MGKINFLVFVFFRPYYYVFNDTNSGVRTKINQRNNVC